MVEALKASVINIDSFLTAQTAKAQAERLRDSQNKKQPPQQFATMTIKASFFRDPLTKGIEALSGLLFRLNHPDFGDHVYKIVGAEQSDPLYLNLTCLVDPPDPTLGS